MPRQPLVGWSFWLGSSVDFSEVEHTVHKILYTSTSFSYLCNLIPRNLLAQVSEELGSRHVAIHYTALSKLSLDPLRPSIFPHSLLSSINSPHLRQHHPATLPPTFPHQTYGFANSIPAAAVVATGATPPLHTHADAPVVCELSGGPFVHQLLACHGCVVVLGAAPDTNCALTSTGMMAPVERLKAWWPRTRSSEPPSPEWVVREMMVEGSETKMESRRSLVR